MVDARDINMIVKALENALRPQIASIVGAEVSRQVDELERWRRAEEGYVGRHYAKMPRG